MKAAGELAGVKSALNSAANIAANAVSSKLGLPISFEWMAGDALRNF